MEKFFRSYHKENPSIMSKDRAIETDFRIKSGYSNLSKQSLHKEWPFITHGSVLVGSEPYRKVHLLELSFVIIEYECMKDIYACIDNIKNACNNISYEIIISSNSTYKTEQRRLLQEKLPSVKWVFNQKNGGFSSAMNSGILISSGEAIVLINPDVRISCGHIRKVFDYLMAHQNVGLIGPRIIDGNGDIQDSCRSFMGLKELIYRTIDRVYHSKNVLLDRTFDYGSTQPVDWVIGAFMMVKRAALAKVGLLDQNYFLYVEDMDWCKRFWECGYFVVYYPEFEVVYEGDRKSTRALYTKSVFNKFSFIHFKSYLRFLWKNRFSISR